MRLYHNTDAKSLVLKDQPIFLSLTLAETQQYMQLWPESTSFELKPVRDLKLISGDDLNEAAQSVFGQDFLYSMLHEAVGEYEVEDIRSFISGLDEQGYDGAILDDYSPDHQGDTKTACVFNPVGLLQVLSTVPRS